MIEVIPAINFKTFEEVRKSILAVELFTAWVQIDVSDGVFTPYENWHEPEEWKYFSPQVLIELHLMVEDPLVLLPRWLKHVKPARVIAHLESWASRNAPSPRRKNRDAVSEFVSMLRKKHVSVGLALKPETPVDAIRPWMGQIDLVQTLAVEPGPSGQFFHLETCPKIKALQKWAPFRIIEVDGGITPGTARACAQVGADAVVSGEFIFSGEGQPEKQIEKLRAATYGIWEP